jgi:4-hydroxy-tetrahydrodipicolinate synthase
MKKPIFTGSGLAMVTPMKSDGSVNYYEIDRLVEYQIEHGTDAIIACGTTGEAPTLEDDEHLEVIGHVAKRSGGRIPVIGGTGSNNTAHAIMMSKEAADVGADALLVVTPYYNKTSQDGLVASYTAIADATDLPVIMYNVPSRTGVNIMPETAKRLSAHPRINAIKEASGNISQIAKTAALCGGELNIYSGNDDQIVPILSLGGKGVISVLAHVAPQATHDICALWFEGKTSESSAMQLKYLELCNALFCDVNPIPVKAAMNMLGWDVGDCRLPLVRTSEANLAKIRAALDRAGLLKN